MKCIIFVAIMLVCGCHCQPLQEFPDEGVLNLAVAKTYEFSLKARGHPISTIQFANAAKKADFTVFATSLLKDDCDDSVTHETQSYCWKRQVYLLNPADESYLQLKISANVSGSITIVVHEESAVNVKVMQHVHYAGKSLATSQVMSVPTLFNFFPNTQNEKEAFYYVLRPRATGAMQYYLVSNASECGDTWRYIDSPGPGRDCLSNIARIKLGVLTIPILPGQRIVYYIFAIPSSAPLEIFLGREDSLILQRGMNELAFQLPFQTMVIKSEDGMKDPGWVVIEEDEAHYAVSTPNASCTLKIPRLPGFFDDCLTSGNPPEPIFFHQATPLYIGLAIGLTHLRNTSIVFVFWRKEVLLTPGITLELTPNEVVFKYIAEQTSNDETYYFVSKPKELGSRVEHESRSNSYGDCKRE
jgi:hypothetical protein